MRGRGLKVTRTLKDDKNHLKDESRVLSVLWIDEQGFPDLVSYHGIKAQILCYSG